MKQKVREINFYQKIFQKIVNLGLKEEIEQGCFRRLSAI